MCTPAVLHYENELVFLLEAVDAADDVAMPELFQYFELAYGQRTSWRALALSRLWRGMCLAMQMLFSGMDLTLNITP